MATLLDMFLLICLIIIHIFTLWWFMVRCLQAQRRPIRLTRVNTRIHVSVAFMNATLYWRTWQQFAKTNSLFMWLHFGNTGIWCFSMWRRLMSQVSSLGLQREILPYRLNYVMKSNTVEGIFFQSRPIFLRGRCFKNVNDFYAYFTDKKIFCLFLLLSLSRMLLLYKITRPFFFGFH